MTAYNIVRMRVKEGHEDEYMALHKQLFATAGPDMKAAGLRRFSLVKTGERAYCVLGEWESFDSIVKARPLMIGSLDKLRGILEDLGGGLGVTDPVSGEAAAEYDMR